MTERPRGSGSLNKSRSLLGIETNSEGEAAQYWIFRGLNKSRSLLGIETIPLSILGIFSACLNKSRSLLGIETVSGARGKSGYQVSINHAPY